MVRTTVFKSLEELTTTTVVSQGLGGVKPSLLKLALDDGSIKIVACGRLVAEVSADGSVTRHGDLPEFDVDASGRFTANDVITGKKLGYVKAMNIMVHHASVEMTREWIKSLKGGAVCQA